MDVQTIWNGGMAFSAELNGHTVIVDAAAADGGRDLGPRPKGLLLVALAGCTGMDVVSILKKMRLEADRIAIRTIARVAGQHPRKFETITVRYEFSGERLPADKLRQAVRLSQEKYCGVSATLQPGVEIGSEIWLNGSRLP